MLNNHKHTLSSFILSWRTKKKDEWMQNNAGKAIFGNSYTLMYGKLPKTPKNCKYVTYPQFLGLAECMTHTYCVTSKIKSFVYEKNQKSEN